MERSLFSTNYLLIDKMMESMGIKSENTEKREPKKSENLENLKIENPQKAGKLPEGEYKTISYVDFEGRVRTHHYQKVRTKEK
jgi:hypothetical protein